MKFPTVIQAVVLMLIWAVLAATLFGSNPERRSAATTLGAGLVALWWGYGAYAKGAGFASKDLLTSPTSVLGRAPVGSPAAQQQQAEQGRQ
jgi:hypothetical protein